MSGRIIVGGYCEYFESDNIISNLDGRTGLLVGMDSGGKLVPAGDCHPFLGIYGGRRLAARGHVHAVDIGMWSFSTDYFVDGLVVGQRVYARDGLLVGSGIESVGIFAGLRNGMAMVVR